MPPTYWNRQSREGGGANVQWHSYCLLNLPLLVLTWYQYHWWDRYYWYLDQSTHHYCNLILATSTTGIFSWLLAITAPWKPQKKKQRWRLWPLLLKDLNGCYCEGSFNRAGWHLHIKRISSREASRLTLEGVLSISNRLPVIKAVFHLKTKFFLWALSK